MVASKLDKSIAEAAAKALADNPDMLSYGRVVDGQYQSVTRPTQTRNVDPNAPIRTRTVNPSPGLVSRRTEGAVSPGQMGDVGTYGGAGRGVPLGSPVSRRTEGALSPDAAADAGFLSRVTTGAGRSVVGQGPNRGTSFPTIPTSTDNLAGAFGAAEQANTAYNQVIDNTMIDDSMFGDMMGWEGVPIRPDRGPSLEEMDSRAFDEAMKGAAKGNLGDIEQAFWGLVKDSGPPEPAKCGEGLVSDGAGGCLPDPALTGDPPIECGAGTVPDGKGGCMPDPALGDGDGDGDGVPDYDFGDQATLIEEQLGGLATADLTSKITALIAEARTGARSLNTETIRQITAGYDLQETQINAIAAAATETVKATESLRSAAIDSLVTDVATRADEMVANQAANVASGTALAGPNQLTSEFAEVVTLTNALVESVAVGAKGSMSRIRAVANIAAAQRLAAPALMMADAKNALGAEKFALEGQAQLALEQTLNSLNVQEKEMVFNEAMRIEQFNNNRDMALAQALINNGMAKLQYTIEEQRRDEDYARRQAEIMQQRADAAAAAAESKRRWQAETNTQQFQWATGVQQQQKAQDFAQGMAREQMDLSLTQEGRLQEAQDAATKVALDAGGPDLGDQAEAASVARQVYGPNATEAQIAEIGAMSSAQRNTRLADALKKAPGANIKAGTFEGLKADGFSPGTAQSAITYVQTEREWQTLEKNLDALGVDMAAVATAVEEIAGTGDDLEAGDLTKHLKENEKDWLSANQMLTTWQKKKEANVKLMEKHISLLTKEGLSAEAARALDFQAAIDRINAVQNFELRAVNPSQAAAQNNAWAFMPYTTYVDTGRTPWLQPATG